MGHQSNPMTGRTECRAITFKSINLAGSKICSRQLPFEVDQTEFRATKVEAVTQQCIQKQQQLDNASSDQNAVQEFWHFLSSHGRSKDGGSKQANCLQFWPWIVGQIGSETEHRQQTKQKILQSRNSCVMSD
jgi:hypothetical protein